MAAAEEKASASKWAEDEPDVKSAKAAAKEEPGAESGAKGEPAAAKGGGNPNIVSEVMDFFYGNDDFANFFEEWANEHCHLVSDAEAAEYALGDTDVYEQFIALFEKKMEAFIESRGSTIAEFYDRIRQTQTGAEDSDETIFAKIIMATTDFDIFMVMMREAQAAMARRRK